MCVARSVRCLPLAHCALLKQQPSPPTAHLALHEAHPVFGRGSIALAKANAWAVCAQQTVDVLAH